jgi:MFS family permease
VNRQEKKTLTLITASHGLVHLFEGVLPPLIPLLVSEFGTDYFHLGLVVTVFSYAFGMGSLPAGVFSDRFGPRRLITLYLLGSGLLSICIWPVGSLYLYGVLMGLVGLFCSVYHPASNTLISLSIREKGKAFGIHGVAGSLGVAVVPGLSAWIGSAMGWRAPHVLFGLFGLCVAVYSLSVGRPTWVASSLKQDEGSGGGSGTASYLNLVVFFLSATFLGLTYKGIMTFLPVYMGQNVHSDLFGMDTVALGGTIATLALLSGALGQYLAGRFSDRYRPEQLYLGALILGTLFVFFMAYGSNSPLVGSAVLYAFFYFSTQPIQNYLLSRYLPENRHGLGYGIQFGLTFGVGSIAAAVCGYLADHFGLRSVFNVMGLCFVASSLLASVLVIRVRTQEKHPAR